MMDAHREVALYGAVVASAVGLTIDESVPALKMDQWKTAAAASERAPNRYVP